MFFAQDLKYWKSNLIVNLILMCELKFLWSNDVFQLEQKNACWSWKILAVGRTSQPGFLAVGRLHWSHIQGDLIYTAIGQFLLNEICWNTYCWRRIIKINENFQIMLYFTVNFQVPSILEFSPCTTPFEKNIFNILYQLEDCWHTWTSNFFFFFNSHIL